MNDENVQEQSTQDDLITLKERADSMGISYHPSIGLDKLRDKVNAGSADKSKAYVTAPVVVKESESAKRNRLNKDATRLIRIRLTCMNPAKKEWDGEIFTVGNAGVGSIKKFIPFNADDGWHVPNIMLQALKDRQCQIFTSERTKHGVTVRKGKLIKEFNIEILDSLTQGELNELARRQAMADAAE